MSSLKLTPEDIVDAAALMMASYKDDEADLVMTCPHEVVRFLS